MGFALYISEKEGSERREVFDKSEVVVGRVQGNDLMLPKGNVSKRHAKLLIRDNLFFVSDLHSTNGTYVNGRKIAQDTPVREGDKIYIGDFVLRLESVSISPAQESTTDDDDHAARAVSSSPATLAPPLPPRESVVPPAGVASSDIPHKHVSAAPPLNHNSPSETPPKSSTGATLAPSFLSIAPFHDTYQLTLELLLAATAEAIDLSPLDGDNKVSSVFRREVELALQMAADKLRADGDIAATLPMDRLVTDAHRELFGLGPIELFLLEDVVTEVPVVHFYRIFALRGSQVVRVSPTFSSQLALRRVLIRLCARSGSPLATNELLVERTLPLSMTLSALLAPLSEGGDVLQLRKRRSAGASLESLVQAGALSQEVASFLTTCLSARINLLLVAPQMAITSPVFAAIAEAVSRELRVAVLHHAHDTTAVAPHVVSMSLNGPAAPAMVKAAAGMSFPHLFVDMVSGDVTASLLTAIAEGTRGVVAEFHAPSLLKGLERLVPMLGAFHLGLLPEVAGAWVACSFDVVIEVGYLHSGRLSILRVAELMRYQAHEFVLQDIFVMDEREPADRDPAPSLRPTEHVPRFFEELKRRGVHLVGYNLTY